MYLECLDRVINLQGQLCLSVPVRSIHLAVACLSARGSNHIVPAVRVQSCMDLCKGLFGPDHSPEAPSSL
jgi:hypothetical protein